MSSDNPFAQSLQMEMQRAEHCVTIMTRYGETTRECYCSATGREEHNEFQTPWLTWEMEQNLTPEARAQRRMDWRVYTFVRNFNAYELLEFFVKETCEEHEDKSGGIHLWKQNSRTPMLCIPKENLDG